MNREIAERALALLDERGWFGGGQKKTGDGQICLGQAVATAARGHRDVVLGSAPGTWYDVAEISELCAVVERLFPERDGGSLTPQWVVADFNDHEHTTLEDVRLVVKHAVTP